MLFTHNKSYRYFRENTLNKTFQIKINSTKEFWHKSPPGVNEEKYLNQIKPENLVSPYFKRLLNVNR